MNSRSRSRRTSLGFSVGTAYSTGLSTSYGTGLGSTTYTTGYSSPSYTGYSNFTSRATPSYSTSLSGYSSGKDFSSNNTSSRYSSSTTYTSPVTTTSPYNSNRYTGSKTDSNLLTERGTYLNWRSKSIEPSRNEYRDHSSSREPVKLEFNYRTGRERSSGRDLSSPRDYTPSREYRRAGSMLPDSLPLSPRTKSHQSTNHKLPAYDSVSRFNNATQSMYRPLSRSNSFHDLRDVTSPSTPRNRARHQTLTFGVSEMDLERAKSTISMSSRGSMSDLRGASWRGSNRDLSGNPSNGSYDLTNGYHKSDQDLGYNSQPASRSDSFVPARNSTSAHVSFLSPPIESIVQLPSYSSVTSSLPPNPFSTSANFQPHSTSLYHHAGFPSSDCDRYNPNFINQSPHFSDKPSKVNCAYTSNALNESFQQDSPRTSEEILRSYDNKRRSSDSTRLSEPHRPFDSHRLLDANYNLRPSSTSAYQKDSKPSSLPPYINEINKPSSLPPYLNELNKTSSLPFYLPEPSKQSTLPYPSDVFRTNSQLSQHLTGSLTSLPTSLPPCHSTNMLPSFPSELSIASLPTHLSQTNKTNTDGLLLLKKDDLDAFLAKNIPSSSSQTTTDKSSKSVNGDIDYKKLALVNDDLLKLWEESQAENTRLRMEMSSIRQDLDSSKHQLETAIQASTKNAVSDAEKREKKMLEKKLGEMEEELKQLQKLKAENEKLKSENRALTRVVSKLTAAATKTGSSLSAPQTRK